MSSGDPAPTDQAPRDSDVASDPQLPNIARIYDYLLGGRDNFAADREVGREIEQALPAVRVGVQEQRAALRRVVRYLVDDVGLRQLIDIGTGLPTVGNVHEIAHAVAPDTRVVYVDNDPIVLAHSQALISGERWAKVIEGDLRQPEKILSDSDLRSIIDLKEPVGLILSGVLHHILDEEGPVEIVDRLVATLAPGSHVFIHHLVRLNNPAAGAAEAVLQASTGRGTFRSIDEIRCFFRNLKIIDPGIVSVSEWRPDPGATVFHPVFRLAVVGVAYKP